MDSGHFDQVTQNSIIFILFYRLNTPYEIWVQTAQWILRNRCLDMYKAVQCGWPLIKIKGQLDLCCLYKTSVSIGLSFFASTMISLKQFYRKMNISRFFQYKYIRNQIRPCRKKDQGQPRFNICANLVGPTSPMLYTKSQGHWPVGSRIEDI